MDSTYGLRVVTTELEVNRIPGRLPRSTLHRRRFCLVAKVFETVPPPPPPRLQTQNDGFGRESYALTHAAKPGSRAKQAKPSQAKLKPNSSQAQAKPSRAKPSQVEPSRSKQSQTEPEKPSQHKPSQATPMQGDVAEPRLCKNKKT